MGTERYSWELLRGLEANGLDACGIASNPSRKRFSLAFNALTKIPAKALASLHGTALFHATDPSSAIGLPRAGPPTVVTIHDLVPLLLGRVYYTAGDRVFSTLSYASSVKCDAIVAVSEQTKRELVRYFKVPPRKVRVIHHGVSESFKPTPGPREPVVGYVGDINPRKRIDLLLEAFAIVQRGRPEAKLVIVGKNIAEYLTTESGRIRGMVKTLGLEGSVVFTGHVSEEELVKRYNSMRVMVLPSEYEGFGFPILEAQRCGTPVIVRKGVRIPEEVAASALKAGSVSELAELISEVLDEPRFAEEVAAAGLRHSGTFTWGKCVAETLSLYRSLLAP